MTKEEREHRERATRIVNQLGEEYATWHERPGLGRYVALGEYILEETDSDQFHDSWLITAREAFLKWKKDQRC
jgi:hypothetical protein